ncbi:MAG TPA: mechanosensitive ion channel domain-containing protein [Candidatus Binatia bacterium]|jgi:small conductance mechanosensitive channel|nr:mechanosensitive ion channel domain-containing protein [Candidatus Binatia bacterium]
MSPTDLTLDLIIRYGFQVLGAVIILALGALTARWVGNWGDRWLQGHVKEPPMRILMVRIVRVLILMMALLIALDKFGFQVAPLVAAIGVAGLGVGLAFQGVLGNLVAGLTIIFTKPYRVGEYIELLGVYGQVTTIELFSTTLIHPDESRVVIPNRKVVGEILHNYGRVRQISLSVGLAYGADFTDALALAREIVKTNPRVLKTPEPIIGINELGASSVTLMIQPWVPIADVADARAELYRALVERFREKAIEIPLPRSEVLMLQNGR